MAGGRFTRGQESVVPSEISGDTELADRWRFSALLVFFSVICLLMAFRQTIWAMLHTWESSKTYSHCFLIVPMFAYLVWLRRKRILSASLRVSYWGLILLLLGTMAWLLGNLGEVREIQEFALVAIFSAVVWTLLGNAVFSVLVFPLLFLFFAVPFGVSLVRPLQAFTAWFTVHALTLSNVPAVLESHAISLPSSTWAVGETCSGIRYLFASTVVGVFYSSIVYRSRKRQLIFVLASLVLPVVANGFRAYGIVLLAYVTNYRVATGVDHIIYGGVFFIALQIALLTIGLRWREAPKDYVQTASGGLPRGAPGLTKEKVLLAAVAIALIVFTPLLSKRLWDRSATAVPGPEGLSVVVDPSWQRVEIVGENWDDPEFCNLDEEFRQQYQSGRQRVDVCWASYSSKDETELEGASRGYGNPGLWLLAAESARHASLNGKRITVDQELLQSATNQRLVWTVYWVAGEYTSDASRVKLLRAKARLLGKSAATAVIALGSDDPVGGIAAAQNALQNFFAHASFSVPPQS